MIIMGVKQPLQTMMGGWMEAERIGRGECLLIKNAGCAYVSASAAAVLKTHNPLRGLHSADDAPDCGWGQLIDFSRYPHVDFSQATVHLRKATFHPRCGTPHTALRWETTTFSSLAICTAINHPRHKPRASLHAAPPAWGQAPIKRRI